MLEATVGKRSHTFRGMLLIDKTVLIYIDLQGKYMQIAHRLPSHLSTPVFYLNLNVFVVCWGPFAWMSVNGLVHNAQILPKSGLSIMEHLGACGSEPYLKIRVL